MTNQKGPRGKVMAPPPDGGWGWPVTIASFLTHFILDGISYSIGVFVVGLIDYFEASRAEAGWVGSIMMGVTYSAGPIASVLCKRYGCRVVTILGALIGAFGLILSIFCPNIHVMYITFGLITGFGLGMTYLPAIVCVAYYFEQKRSMAIGIACCGSGVGTLVFGVFAGWLLDNFGWRGGMLIEAGLVLNCCAIGMIFVEPTLSPAKLKALQSNKEIKLATDEVDSNAAKNAAMSKLDDVDVIVGNGSAKKSNGNLPSSSSLDKQRSGSVHSLPHSKKAASSSSLAKHKSEEALAMMAADREAGGEDGEKVKDKNLSRSILNLPNYRSNPDLYSTPNARGAAATADATDSNICNPASLKKTGLAAVKEMIGSLMDFSLLYNKLFLTFAISNFLTSIGYLVPYIFLPDRAMEMDMTKEQSALLITILGGANTVGRVVFGFLSDFLSIRVYLNRTLLYCSALTIVGILTIVSILCETFWSMALYSASFGFLMGVYVLLTSVVLIDLLSVEKLSNSFGLVLLFQGIASIIGPPIAGAMYDSTGSYNVPFAVNGLLIAVSGAMIYFYYCMPSYRRRCKVVAAEARKKMQETGSVFACHC